MYSHRNGWGQRWIESCQLPRQPPCLARAELRAVKRSHTTRYLIYCHLEAKPSATKLEVHSRITTTTCTLRSMCLAIYRAQNIRQVLAPTFDKGNQQRERSGVGGKSKRRGICYQVSSEPQLGQVLSAKSISKYRNLEAEFEGRKRSGILYQLGKASKPTLYLHKWELLLLLFFRGGGGGNVNCHYQNTHHVWH